MLACYQRIPQPAGACVVHTRYGNRQTTQQELVPKTETQTRDRVEPTDKPATAEIVTASRIATLRLIVYIWRRACANIAGLRSSPDVVSSQRFNPLKV